MKYNDLEELVLESKGVLRQVEYSIAPLQAKVNPEYWKKLGPAYAKSAETLSESIRQQIRDCKNSLRETKPTEKQLKRMERRSRIDEKREQLHLSQIDHLEAQLQQAEDDMKKRKDMEKQAAIAIGLATAIGAIAGGATAISSSSNQSKTAPYIKKLNKLRDESRKLTTAYQSGKLSASDYVQKQLKIKKEVESSVNAIESICRNDSKPTKESANSGIVDIYESVGCGYITEEEAGFLLKI